MHKLTLAFLLLAIVASCLGNKHHKSVQGSGSLSGNIQGSGEFSAGSKGMHGHGKESEADTDLTEPMDEGGMGSESDSGSENSPAAMASPHSYPKFKYNPKHRKH